MKKLLFILATIISLNCFAQDKIVKIPQSELDAFFLAIDTLEFQDSIKTVYIKNLETQNTRSFVVRQIAPLMRSTFMRVTIPPYLHQTPGLSLHLGMVRCSL